MCRSGYKCEKLPPNMDYDQLTKRAKSHFGPILVSLTLNNEHGFRHVIGICPHLSGLQIIDDCHPELRPILYSRENLSWCCGDGLTFTSIAKGFLFHPGKKVQQRLDLSGRIYESQISKVGFESSLPPTIEGSSKLPVRVTTGSWNCATGNAVNLLHSIKQACPQLASSISKLRVSPTSDILRLVLHEMEKFGYICENLLPNMDYDQLIKRAMSHLGPILVSLTLDNKHGFHHVIGICPHLSGLQIIDGYHPELQPIPYSRENLSWCCGVGLTFTSIVKGFLFYPGKNLERKFKMSDLQI